MVELFGSMKSRAAGSASCSTRCTVAARDISIEFLPITELPRKSIRTNRDVLFDGTGPDVSEENLAPLRKAMKSANAAIGFATDGDADRFGIIDSDGTWISPNHILALLYDYLVESRGLETGRGAQRATSHLIDAVARLHRLPVYQTPVGFKYVGELIEQDKIALGGEESAGLSIRGHIPEKDGILACLLVAEMTAVRGKSIGEQIRDLFRRVGGEFWPLRTNLHLTPQIQKRTVARLKNDYTRIRWTPREKNGSHRRTETRIRRWLLGAAAPFWNRAVTSPIHRSCVGGARLLKSPTTHANGFSKPSLMENVLNASMERTKMNRTGIAAEPPTFSSAQFTIDSCDRNRRAHGA